MREATFRLGQVVKLIQVVEGEGETDYPDNNELLLRQHIGETCKVKKVGEMSIRVAFKNGDAAWAVPEEVSRNMRASLNPTKYGVDASEFAERLVDRHDGNFNKALHEAQTAIWDAKSSGDQLFLERAFTTTSSD